MDHTANLVGVNYNDKTISNIKTFLDAYKILNPCLRILPKEVTDSFLDEAPGLYKVMISKEEIPRDTAEDIIVRLFKKGDVEALIIKVLEMVSKFGEDGEKYKTILKMLYFEKEPHTNKEVQIVCKLSRTPYFEYKRRALILFGISFWSLIIEKSGNPSEFVKELEERYGRDNRLSGGLTLLM